ncbi:hypothetical protein [Streptomyces sp. NPDC014676]|uniref:hypothetical protein n=1 Tax=Streptomyces sp. NPDC014676 TaxID=3364879 RepID=UPI0036FA3A02
MDLHRLPAEEMPGARVPEPPRRARAALPGPGASKPRRAVAVSDLSRAHLAACRCTGHHRDREEPVSAAMTGRLHEADRGPYTPARPAGRYAHAASRPGRTVEAYGGA